METKGRTTIYANFREKDLLNADDNEQIAIITNILQNSVSIHDKNRNESIYLMDYLYGKQDIAEKIKKTRVDINNKSVENWAWAFQDLKKGMLVGNPIKYAPFDNKANNEITDLNKYVLARDKESLDQDTYEELFAVGRSYKYVWASQDDKDAPFDLVNAPIYDTEIVYSSSIKHEQILAYIVTPQMYTKQQRNEQTQEMDLINIQYNDYTVYTRKYVYTFNDRTGEIQYVKDSKLANVYNKHIIYEYYLNKYRVSLLELAKDIFNDLNYIESLDKDDIESFVNAILVFTNASVDKEKMDDIKEFGAISIKSTNDKKASVDLLQNRLKSSDTQAFYMRKLFSLHAILGVPLSQSNGSTNAETGKASMIEQGFTSANLRTENEEKAFKKCDRKVLDMILTICRESKDSTIKNLKYYDVDITFSRDLSDNILTKTQALRDLALVHIPPEIANSVVHLFSDPVAVTNLQKKYEEELEQKEIEKQERFKQNALNNKNTNNKENLKDESQTERSIKVE